MYLGLDIGTSGIKAVLVDDEQEIVAQATAPLDVSRPHELWSEQDPDDWWTAVGAAVGRLKNSHPGRLSAVRGIGLSGQMHGATLLDDGGRPLRPGILWNDGRSAKAGLEIERREPRSREITGNLAMAGFTAPKLVWVAENEPEVFSKTAKVLLPKDYVRFRLTGGYVSEMSDSSGTLWLDVEQRRWSDEMLDATGLSQSHMPDLIEGNASSGELRPALASEWGMNSGVIVAGGAGDNAAGAVGVGTVVPGRAFLSLGTSGVYFATNRTYSPSPERAVHAFCHCLPDVWHQMSVILSAASCLTWVTKLTGAACESAMIDEIEAAGFDRPSPQFLPYLSGERTPHNDPNAKGVFFGLTHEHDRASIGRAVLEGVAFAFADGQNALVQAGARIDMVSVIGGGARSKLWGKILASALDRELTYHKDGEVGPAFGAARLGRMAVTGEAPIDVCTQPDVDDLVSPDSNLRDHYEKKFNEYRRLYEALKPVFANSTDQPHVSGKDQ